MPLLTGNTGAEIAVPLEWYQDEYTKCAANHNGLIEALKKRGIE